MLPGKGWGQKMSETGAERRAPGGVEGAWRWYEGQKALERQVVALERQVPLE